MVKALYQHTELDWREQLDQLREENSINRKDFRDWTYDFLQRIAIFAAGLQGDAAGLAAFADLCKKSDKLEQAGDWLLRETIAYVSKARSTKQRQKASKHAIAVRYLLDDCEVSLTDLARELRLRGGIEAIARLASATHGKSSSKRTGLPVRILPKTLRRLTKLDRDTRVELVGRAAKRPNSSTELIVFRARPIAGTEKSEKNSNSREGRNATPRR